MEIKLLTSLVTDRRSYERGETVHWPDRADAERLIAAGYAKPAGQQPQAPKGRN